MSGVCRYCFGPLNRPVGVGWTCLCGQAWYGPNGSRNPVQAEIKAAIHRAFQEDQGPAWRRDWASVPMRMNLRGPRSDRPWRFLNAFSRAYRSVRRDVWDARESRLRAKWESYG